MLKIIARLDNGHVLVEGSEQDWNALNLAWQMILAAIDHAPHSTPATTSGAPAAPSSATPTTKNRRGRPPGKATKVRREKPAPAAHQADAPLPVRHCDVCGQDYQPTRCDQTKHGKRCPGTPSAPAPAATADPAPTKPHVSEAARKIAALREARQLERDRIGDLTA